MSTHFYSSSLFSPHRSNDWRRTTLFVILLHVMILGWGMHHSSAVTQRPQSRPVVVQTLHLTPLQRPTTPPQTPPKTNTATHPVTPPTQATPSTKKQTTPKPKPETVKPANTSAPVTQASQPTQKAEKTENQKGKAKTEVNQKKPEAKQQTVKKQQAQQALDQKQQKERQEAEKKEEALWAQAQDHLAKMQKTSHQLKPASSLNLETIPLPQTLTLEVEALSSNGDESLNLWGNQEMSYRDALSYHLKHTLKLPEYGAVEIKLTLDQSGKVKKVMTVQAESQKNKTYVENQISKMTFSSFDHRFKDASEYTFLITLRNY